MMRKVDSMSETNEKKWKSICQVKSMFRIYSSFSTVCRKIRNRNGQLQILGCSYHAVE